MGTVTSTLLDLLLRVVSRAPSISDRLPLPGPVRRQWLRLRNEALARHPRDFTVRLHVGGAEFSGNTEDVIQRSIYLHQVWEPDITSWLVDQVGRGSVVVDVGANCGYDTLVAASLVGPEGQVIAFEPVPSIVARLAESVRANRLGQVSVRNVALGREPGTTEIFRADGSNTGNSSTSWEPGHTSEGTVDVARGDTYLVDEAARISVIKIDTEGDEVNVIGGLTRTLAAMSPGAAVLVEVTPDKLALRGHTALELWNLFPRPEWECFQIRNDYDFENYRADQPVRMSAVTMAPRERADLVFVRRG